MKNYLEHKHDIQEKLPKLKVKWKKKKEYVCVSGWVGQQSICKLEQY